MTWEVRRLRLVGPEWEPEDGPAMARLSLAGELAQLEQVNPAWEDWLRALLGGPLLRFVGGEVDALEVHPLHSEAGQRILREQLFLVGMTLIPVS